MSPQQRLLLKLAAWLVAILLFVIAAFAHGSWILLVGIGMLLVCIGFLSDVVAGITFVSTRRSR
jgi:Kef-type K+ transport system membrane component KefB